MKKQRTFYIDLVLTSICLLTLITGLIIHAAGHGIVQSNVRPFIYWQVRQASSWYCIGEMPALI